jgi:hypothetical protein
MRGAVRVYREITFAVGLALSQAAVAAPPDSPDPALAPWFESLKQPGTGASCCSIADCRTVEFRQDRDGYEVFIDGRWKMSTPFWLHVRRIGSSTEATTPRDRAAWFASRLRPAFSVSCVRPRVNRQFKAILKTNPGLRPTRIFNPAPIAARKIRYHGEIYSRRRTASQECCGYGGVLKGQALP